MATFEEWWQTLHKDFWGNPLGALKAAWEARDAEIAALEARIQAALACAQQWSQYQNTPNDDYCAGKEHALEQAADELRSVLREDA